MSRTNKRRKEEICEGLCFTCKDGGDLLICDYNYQNVLMVANRHGRTKFSSSVPTKMPAGIYGSRKFCTEGRRKWNCLKAYHLECVGKDESILESGELWRCKWHSCFLCNKSSKFRCLCCPVAVCGRCLRLSEFVLVKTNKGFCQNCLKLASLIEDVLPADSEQVVVDFKDEETYEFFFLGYWEIIKKEELLNKECLRSANELLKNNCNCTSDLYLLDIGKIQENAGDSGDENDRFVSDCDELEDVDEYKPGRKRGRFKRKSCDAKTKKNEFEFVGWGSKSLLEFLDSVGEDTSKAIKEYEVVSVVMKYCVENKLFDPLKKKRIICDETLRSLFKKKFVLKNSLNKLLAVHFAVNCEQTTGDGLFNSSSSDEEKEDANLNLDLINTKKSLGSTRKTQKAKANPDVKKSCYAMVNSENIKLVYLKRSLLEELLKKPAEFSEKVVGSFARVKCNPNDYLQKNSHQLLQVKGVSASNSGQILLQFFDCPEDFPVSKLSNDNFTEEECEDLRDRIRDGLLQKPTVVELEHKARNLHKDMINHWIPKEMEFLQRRIDQANEKGWRRELSEYVDRIQLLGEESERQRLLNALPEIIAEPLIVQESENDYRDGLNYSPEMPISKDFGSEMFSYQSDTEECHALKCVTSENEKPPQEWPICHALIPEFGDNGHKNDKIDSGAKDQSDQSVTSTNEKPPLEHFVLESEVGNNAPEDLACKLPVSEDSASPEVEPSSSSVIVLEHESPSKVEVIALSDSEPELDSPVKKDIGYRDTRDSRNQGKGSTLKESLERTSYDERSGHRSRVDVNVSQWYCRTAHGYRAGPFKISTLKKGFETRDHKVEMWVWMKGWNEDDAILLDDAIHRVIFPWDLNPESER